MVPPFLCLASSVTPKDADSAALEPQLTALHPISWGLPPGTLGSLRPTCPGEGAVTAVELREQGTGGGALPAGAATCLQDSRTVRSSDPQAGGGVGAPQSPRGRDLPDPTWGSGLTL